MKNLIYLIFLVPFLATSQGRYAPVTSAAKDSTKILTTFGGAPKWTYNLDIKVDTSSLSTRINANGTAIVSLNAKTSKTTKTLYVTDFGAVPNDGVDDTQAIISADSTLFVLGGGNLIWPNGVYNIAGALKTSVNGTNPNCQIPIPLSRYGVDSGVSIKWVGESLPNYTVTTDANGANVAKGGVVLLSTIAGTGTLPAVIGTPTYSSALGAWNHTWFSMYNFVVRTTTNTGSTHFVGTMSGINLENLSNFSGDNVSVETTSILSNMAAPTNETYGIIFPKQLNFAYLEFGSFRVLGYKYGFVPGEHLNIKQAYVVWCNSALYAKNAQQHGIYIANLSVENTTYAFRVDANNSILVSSFHAEHNTTANNWYNTVYDVYVTNSGVDRSVFIDHVNIGTYGSVGAVEYNWLTNNIDKSSYKFINGSDIEYAPITLSTGNTWDVQYNKRGILALTANSTLTLNNPRAGELINLLVKQDATGSRTLTINGNVVTVTSTALAVDRVTGFYDGTNWNFSSAATSASGGVSVPSATNLVASYDFENTSWTDNTSNGFNLTAFNSPTNGSGKVGNAALFSGSGASLRGSASNTLSVGAGGFTVLGWFKVTSGTTGTRFFASKYIDAGNVEWFLYWTSSGTNAHFGVSTDGTNGSADVIKTMAADGAWHHVAGVWNGTNIVVYVDGVVSTSAAITTIKANGTAPLAIGSDGVSSSGSSLIGGADQVRIYQRALTSTEIAYYYNSGAGR